MMSNTFIQPIRVMRIIARMNVGGPAVQITSLMRNLNRKEFDHRLYAGYCLKTEADYLELVAKDIKAFRIQGLGRRVTLLQDLRALIHLIREIRRFRPHIIHTHTAKAGFLGRIASIVSLHPTVRIHTFHGHLLNGYFGYFRKFLIVHAERFLARFTHQILAVGEKVRQDLLVESIGNFSKFEVMHPGLEITKLPSRKSMQELYGLSPRVLQCAFIGRITQIKRPDRFLDVVAEIKKRRVSIEFMMVGDGDLSEVCRERIVNEVLPVKVLGWQTVIERVLAATDVVILTSDNEGTPLSLIQAGMAALPVVTTNVGSIPEIILNGETGIITNLDVQEMADALEKLANNVRLRRQMGAAAREFTIAHFGINRLVHDHELLYKRLIANQAKS